MIRLMTGGLPADVARERTRPTVNLHMLREVITPMERLTTVRYFADVLLGRFVLPYVSLTVVFPDELAAAVVAGVRAYRFVCVHVRDEF